LPQVTVVSGFVVARMTAAGETTKCVRTRVLTWVVQTLVHICKKEKQVLWRSMEVWIAHSYNIVSSAAVIWVVTQRFSPRLSYITDQPRKANRWVMCAQAWMRFDYVLYDFVFKKIKTVSSTFQEFLPNHFLTHCNHFPDTISPCKNNLNFDFY